MSKKHFEALARALASQRPIPGFGGHAYQTWIDCCAEVGGVCWRFKNDFDYTRFMEACKTLPSTREPNYEDAPRQS